MIKRIIFSVLLDKFTANVMQDIIGGKLLLYGVCMWVYIYPF